MMSTGTARAYQEIRTDADHGSDVAEAMKELLIEATLLHWHVAAASRALAGPSDLTNAQVSILRTLVGAPQTVPELAAARSIARQPVQRSVGELKAEGLVRLEENPRHKRSKRVCITAQGKRRLAKMERRQSSWTREITDGFHASRLRTGSRLLRRIRERISTQTLEPAPASRSKGTKS